MIRKLKSGEYRLYSRKVDPKTNKRKNLGTFKTREAAEKHEREVQYFKGPLSSIDEHGRPTASRGMSTRRRTPGCPV